MKKKQKSLGRLLFVILFAGLLAQVQTKALNEEKQSVPTVYKDIDMEKWNNQIRKEKFDMVLPKAMRKNHIDMWIYVAREEIPDRFAAETLGSSSGVFVFTDRGDDHIERAILGRRWKESHRGWGRWQTKLVEECGLYDIIGEAVRVQEPVGGPMSEYDYRFKGIREFVVARDPQRIAVNFRHDLGPWVTCIGEQDGLSHTDYVLLSEELGLEYAKRLVSDEYLKIDFLIRKVPSEIKFLKIRRNAEIEYIKKVFSEIVPNVTKVSELMERSSGEVGFTVYRRMKTGLSQRAGRGRMGWENAVVQGGDIVAAADMGMYAYVLHKGETEPPPEIKKLWETYLKVDKILAETIKAGLTPRQIIHNYKRKFKEAGIIVRDNQLHMVRPKNNWPVYSAGYDPKKTHLSIDCHCIKERREMESENYGPRIGSLGPDWQKNILLPPNHHFVLEYFFYMPSPTSNKLEDQYLYWWNHEQAIATTRGVEYLSPPQKELYLIR